MLGVSVVMLPTLTVQSEPPVPRSRRRMNHCANQIIEKELTIHLSPYLPKSRAEPS